MKIAVFSAKSYDIEYLSPESEKYGYTSEFLTKEALTEIAATTMRNISAFSKGETNENEVTTEMVV